MHLRPYLVFMSKHNGAELIDFWLHPNGQLAQKLGVSLPIAAAFFAYRDAGMNYTLVNMQIREVTVEGYPLMCSIGNRANAVWPSPTPWAVLSYHTRDARQLDTVSGYSRTYRIPLHRARDGMVLIRRPKEKRGDPAFITQWIC